MPSCGPEQIAEIRAFNRFYTRLVGALDEHIVQSDYSLAEARVLYEVGARGTTTAAELGRALGLDRAYLSRILQRHLGAGLLVVAPDPDDRRSNRLFLTSPGKAVYAALNAGSDESVKVLLEPLDAPSRGRLVAAMATIRALLDAETAAAPIVLRPHRIGELGWLIHRQAVLYNQQFGWNGEFEALIARLYHDFAQMPGNPPRDLWVADRAGAVVGSVYVTPYAGREGVSQLRMLYVEPEARGSGLGTTLVAQAVGFARASGYSRMQLWTQSVLVSARRIYAAAGFELVESGPHHSFGQDLIGEYWEKAL